VSSDHRSRVRACGQRCNKGGSARGCVGREAGLVVFVARREQALNMDNLSISKSFSPSAAFAISVETCRQVGLRRYCSGRFVDQVPHIGVVESFTPACLPRWPSGARASNGPIAPIGKAGKNQRCSPSLRRELLACRCCSGLAYASQQKDPLVRNVNQSQKIRMRLGGRPDDLLGPIPQRPRRMWRPTYELIARRWPVSKAICFA